MVGLTEHSNELWNSIRGSEFLGWVNECQGLKDSAPWSQFDNLV